MEKKEWHECHTNKEMDDEEDAIGPAADDLETGRCGDVYHSKGDDAYDDYSCSEALVENTCLNEEIQIPPCVQ